MIKRRSFLQKIAAAGLVASIPAGWDGLFSSDEHLYAASDLLAILGNPLTVREIGQAYLTHFPECQNRNTLRSRLAMRLGSASSKYLKRHISECVREDFALGDTIQLNGWILSHTEARQCALFAMK